MRRAVRVGLGVVVATGVLGGVFWQKLTPLVLRSMTPKVPFADETPPPAPDYAEAASWSVLPSKPEAAAGAPPALPGIDPRSAPVDLFYVHPTSYVGSRWNGPVDDPRVNEASDAGGALIQASAFNACCAIYAPYYRQANGTEFLQPTVDGDRALNLAYSDVARAFHNFLERRGTERPFLIASHSQGSVLAARLLAEEVSGTPLREHLVAAWIVGGAVAETGIAPDLLPCREAEELRCVIAWNARREDFVPNNMELVVRNPQARLCTNPLSWRLDGEHAPASANLGAVFLDHGDPSPRPGFADAQCQGGTLVVREVGKAPRDLMSRILDHVLGEGNLHPIEYQLYWANIRANAAARVAQALHAGG